MFSYDKAFGQDTQESFEQVDQTEEIAESKNVVENDEPETFVVKVEAEKLNLREASNKQSDVLAVLDKGTELLVQKIQGDLVWYRAYTEAGLEGYVMRDFVK